MALTYKDSGVDIDAGDKLVERIKPLAKSTHNERVLADIGLFGGFFDASFSDLKRPVLVASVDGVGTKLKIAFATNVHNTVGQCLVNHCVDDILTSGARPLFFLDYFAAGKLDSDTAASVIEGFAKACKENDCALIGGETAEMPSMYAEGEYDISGTIVGVVDRDRIIDGKNIEVGDVAIGLKSNGLHTNGYSLARKALFSKFKIDDYVEELGETVGEALLRIHKSYFKTVYPLLSSGKIKGIAHVTGGGILGNSNRIIPKDKKFIVDWDAWEVPEIFKLIQKTGDVPISDMRRTFNMGVGMVLFCDKNDADEILAKTRDEGSFAMGEISR